jgi:hypothetical protein
MTVTVVSKRANLSNPPASFLHKHRQYTLQNEKERESLQLVQYFDRIFIQASHTLALSHETHLFRQTGVERLGNLLRLTDTTALDDDVVELL